MNSAASRIFKTANGNGRCRGQRKLTQSCGQRAIEISYYWQEHTRPNTHNAIFPYQPHAGVQRTRGYDNNQTTRNVRTVLTTSQRACPTESLPSSHCSSRPARQLPQQISTKKKEVSPSSPVVVAEEEEHCSLELVEGILEQIGKELYHTE